MTDAYDRKTRAVREQITDPSYDMILLMLAELYGDAPKCTARRAEIFQYVFALPQFNRAARDKLWRETV